MKGNSHDLQLSFLNLQCATARTMFRKPYSSLNQKQKSLVDTSIARLFGSLASMVSELFEPDRQVGFKAGTNARAKRNCNQVILRPDKEGTETMINKWLLILGIRPDEEGTESTRSVFHR